MAERSLSHMLHRDNQTEQAPETSYPLSATYISSRRSISARWVFISNQVNEQNSTHLSNLSPHYHSQADQMNDRPATALPNQFAAGTSSDLSSRKDHAAAPSRRKSQCSGANRVLVYGGTACMQDTLAEGYARGCHCRLYGHVRSHWEKGKQGVLALQITPS